jgi:hypothetical protein
MISKFTNAAYKPNPDQSGLNIDPPADRFVVSLSEA